MQKRLDATALRYGLTLGGVSAFFGILISVLMVVSRSNQNLTAGLSFGGCIAFLALLGLLFEAGHITAHQLGSIGSGTFAGALAGLIGGVAIGIGPSLTTLHFSQPVAFVAGLIFGLVFSGCLFAGLGAGLGACGAMLGQARYVKRSSEPG